MQGTNKMNSHGKLTRKELEILLHLLQDAEENIIRHEMKVAYEKFNITDIDNLKLKINKLLIETLE